MSSFLRFPYQGALNCHAFAFASAGVLAVWTYLRLLEVRTEDEQVCAVPSDHQPEDQDLHLELRLIGGVSSFAQPPE